jgi:rfaE bifunctional protein kinase chain/domain
MYTQDGLPLVHFPQNGHTTAHQIRQFCGETVTSLNTWIPRLAGQRVLVVGDVILDEYLVGKTTRLSREAPIPVLEFEARQLIPGGAANPAANIAALGSTPIQIGVIGPDSAGTNLRQVLQARGIDTGGLVTDAGRPTTVKSRIMAQMGLRFPQQVARLDTLSREPIHAGVERQVRALLDQHIRYMNAVLLSDYHCGLLTPSLVDTIRALAGEAGVLLTADAQGELDKYAGFGIVKCNADEARAYLRRNLETGADFAAAALEIGAALRLTGGMVITRGADGATVAVCASNQAVHSPAPAVTDVYDTVGAGDTAIAVLTLAAAAGASYTEAAALANYASGLVVRRVGNYTPTPAELAWALATWGNGG